MAIVKDEKDGVLTGDEIKLGLVSDDITSNKVCLLLDLIKPLLNKSFACSAIDTLVHAAKSFPPPEDYDQRALLREGYVHDSEGLQAHRQEGLAQENCLVLIQILRVALYRDTDSVMKLLLCFLDQLHVIFGVVSVGLNLKQVPAQRFLNKFGSDYSVALFLVGDLHTEADGLALHREISDQNVCHVCFPHLFLMDTVIAEHSGHLQTVVFKE